MKNLIRCVSPPSQKNFKRFVCLNSPTNKQNSDNKINIPNNLNTTPINEYNCYEEIKKAFNFITFILHKKDNQIKSLKKKINDLEIQINKFAKNTTSSFRISKDLTENNIHTKLNKQDSVKSFNYGNLINNNISNNCSNSNYNSYINLNDSILIPKKFNKIKLFSNNSNTITSQNSNNNSNQIINIGRENYKIPKIDYFNKNQKFLQSSNKKKFTSLDSEKHKARKPILNDKNNNYMDENFSYKINNTCANKINIYNENSIINIQGKKNKINLRINNSCDRKEIKKMFSNDNYISDKQRYRFKNNSLSCDSENPKNEVKNYLREVKSKLNPEDFQKFIRYIKILTNCKNLYEQKILVIEEIKKIFGSENYDLFIKLENITHIKT